MFAPSWVINGQRPQGNIGWVPPSVPSTFQPRRARPLIPMPVHQHQVAHPRMRCKTVKPPPTTTVYPRQQLMDSLIQEKPDSDLGNLDGVLNFNLSNILPPNFGFGEAQQKKAKVTKKRTPNNAPNGASTTTSVLATSKEHPSEMKPEPTENDRIDDGATSPKPLVIDTILPTDSLDQVRPPYSYSELIDLALRSEGEMTVRELYQWIIDHFDYYKHAKPAKWQPSVRHTLTISSSFTKIKKVHGRNLWGHATTRGQALALARQQKNHWKKQKIAEYVKTNKYIRKRKDNKNSTLSLTSPDLNGHELNSSSLPQLQSLCQEEDMDGVIEAVGDAMGDTMLSVSTGSAKSAGNRSKSSSTKSTPAKKTKRSTIYTEEPLPEIVKTQTLTGRTTNKLNYKLFSRKGCVQRSSFRSLGPSRCARSAKSKREIHIKEEQEYTSDDDDGSIQDLFHLDQKEKRGSTKGSGMARKTPANVTPEVATRCHNTIQGNGNGTGGDNDTTSGKHSTTNSDQIGTPAHLVVSNLQEFEPTESTERILASTSALTSFASISEAAMILSSLEASPRPRISRQPDAGLATYSIKIRVEDKDTKEDPENPIPRTLENAVLKSNSEVPKATKGPVQEPLVIKPEYIEADVTEEITEVVFEVEEEGTSDTETQATIDETVEIVMTIVQSPRKTKAQFRGIMPGSPSCQPKTSSPVIPQGCLPSPKNSPIIAHPSFSAQQLSSPLPVGINSFVVPNARFLCTPPLPLAEPDVKPCPQTRTNLASSPQSQAITRTLNAMGSNHETQLPPIRLPMLCPQRPTQPTQRSYRCIRPVTISSPAQGHPNLPYTVSRTPCPPFPSPGWAIPAMHAVYVDREEGNGPHLLQPEIQMAETWRKKPGCKKCCTHPPRGVHPGLQHRGKQPNQPMNEMISPVGMPMFMGGGGRMQSPVFNYGRSLQPVTHTQVHYPLLHPFVMAPSPVRPEQTTQAFMPTDKGILGKPVSQANILSLSPAPANASTPRSMEIPVDNNLHQL